MHLGRLAFLALIGTSAGANARVLEISDEGDVTVYDGTAEAGSVIARKPRDDPATADAFSAAAQRHGLDANLLRAVAWTESRGRNSAVSHKGAVGIMQLMPATAAALGVNPHDPLANINGGAAYLARQFSTFKTIPLALAAYNAGPGAVMRYRGVPPYAETRNYVDKILRLWNGPHASARANASDLERPAVTPPPASLVPVMLIEVPNP